MKDFSLNLVALLNNGIICGEYNEANPVPKRLIMLLEQAGYILSEETKGRISEDLENSILEDLKDYFSSIFLGPNRKYWQTVYSSQDQVERLTDDQMWKDQGELYADSNYLEKIKEREKDESEGVSLDKISVRIILDPFTDSKMEEIMNNFLSYKRPLNSVESMELEALLKADYKVHESTEITIKEILCVALFYHPELQEKLTSLTDVLRFAIYLNGDSQVLIDKKFRLIWNLSTSKRKRVNKLLEYYLINKPESVEEMLKYEVKWKLLIRHIRPTNPQVRAIIDPIYHNSIKTFNSKIEKARRDGNLEEEIRLLSVKPGLLLRNYDCLLRRILEKDNGRELFDKISDAILTKKILPKTLIELSNYYDLRNLGLGRSYVDKKGISHSYSSLPEIDQDFIDLTQYLLLEVLRYNYKQRESLEGRKFYIPDSISDIIDFSRTETGSGFGETGVISLKDQERIGFFLAWIDPEGNNDLDIHAKMLMSDGTVESVSWDRSFKSEHGVYHSGDIRCVPGDCAEFINIDLGKIRESRNNKVYPKMISIYCNDYQNYTLGKSCETWIGITKNQGRERLGDAEIIRKVKLEPTECAWMIAAIIDLEKEEMIEIGRAMQGDKIQAKNDMMKYGVSHFMTTRKLLELQIIARGGSIVKDLDPEDSEIEELDNYGDIMNFIL